MNERSAFPAALFGVVSSLVEERTGIHYSDADRDLFATKVTSRALEAGFESPLDYYYCLRYDDPTQREFDALVETLVVGETYFFREAPQLRVLCNEFIVPGVRHGKRPRIWCAASATGEEPFTVAMLLSELGILDRVELVASDISSKALARAREGMYGERSFRQAMPAERGRWFEQSGERALIRPELRAAIAWHRVNLVDGPAIEGLGRFDAVLCRNVLIYFDDDTVRKVVGSIAGALHEGGRLLVGASESLLRFGTVLACEERDGAFFYRKAA
jgi:chemotaxis protein methyltransferase CheR